LRIGRPAEISVSSRLDASPGAVWDRIVTPEGINDELRPVTMDAAAAAGAEVGDDAATLEPHDPDTLGEDELSETPAETGPAATGRRANGAAEPHELSPVGDNEDAALDALMSDDEANLEDLKALVKEANCKGSGDMFSDYTYVLTSIRREPRDKGQTKEVSLVYEVFMPILPNGSRGNGVLLVTSRDGVPVPGRALA